MDQERARELLERERQRIMNALRKLTPGGDGELADQDQHLADQGSELYQNELDEALVEQLRRELDEVERAEQRLAEGTYGLSIESGQPIPDERLEANPTAERTTEEEQRFERRGG